eukprot:TRINITY_DN1001_c0_g6_i1.p1 TRINITY_DN1001_c0_g6~~TRINITY_DN1001_c0_g6_i1.p1  ORF type:complete len:374 (+),score=84.02 TRINITY_DN1001_c0_g6_i1:46-1122(+)
MTGKGIKASQPISKKGTFGTLSRELKLAAGTLLEVHEKKVKKMLPLDQMQRVEHDAASQRVLLKNAPGHEDWEFVFKSGGTYSTFADFLEKGVNEERRRKGQEPLPLNDSITSAKDKNKKAAPLTEAMSQVKQKKQQEQQRQQQEQQQQPRMPRGEVSLHSEPEERLPPEPLRNQQQGMPLGTRLSPTPQRNLSLPPQMSVMTPQSAQGHALGMRQSNPSLSSTLGIGYESAMETLTRRLHHLAVEYRKGEVTEEQYLHEKRDLMHRIDMAGNDSSSPRGSSYAPSPRMSYGQVLAMKSYREEQQQQQKRSRSFHLGPIQLGASSRPWLKKFPQDRSPRTRSNSRAAFVPEVQRSHVF